MQTENVMEMDELELDGKFDQPIVLGVQGPPGPQGNHGKPGSDGGYYTPVVTQLDEDTIQFAFTGSKEGMPAVAPVTVELPVGQGSGGNVDLTLLDPEEGEVFTVIVPEPTLTGISVSYTGGDVVIGTALTALVGIVVTASYSNGTTKTVTDYTLSGSIAEGDNTITVTYEGMTATFTVTGVEEVPEVTLSSISATYTGGNVAVGTAVTALTGITVTAHYSDGSTATVTDYTLSGEIAEGSNTITVGYGGKTTTFVVTGVAEESGWTPEDFTGTENAFIRDGYYYVNPLNMHYEFKNVITYTDYVEARFDGPFGYAWVDKTNGIEFRDLFGSTIPYVGGSGGSYGWFMKNALIIVRVPLAIYEESGSDMAKALYAITERVAFKLAANYEDYLYEVTDELIDAMTGTPSTTLTDAGYYTGFLTWTGVGIPTATGSNIQCIPCGASGYGELTFETYGIRITNRFQYCVPSTVDTSSLANFKAYLKTRGIKFLNTTAKEVA